MFTTIKVGERFDLFRDRFGMSDGSYFEALEDNDGFMMVTYLGGMDETEKKALEYETIHTRLIRDGNKIMFLNRYGNTPLIFEVTFDPTLYGDKRAMQIAFNNHMVMFVGVERSNNTVQTLRMANFPMKLKQALITAWTSAYEEENYSENLRVWTNRLYQYDTMTLWKNAEDVGFFGEKGLLDG